MPEIRCAHCEAASNAADPAHPRCPRCDIGLLLDDVTGGWISPAELDHRRRASRTEQAIEESRITVQAHLADASALLPDGWSIEGGQVAVGSVHALTVAVPPQPIPASAATGTRNRVIAIASLTPVSDNRGWHVEVTNQVRPVSYPLFTDGGARAAEYNDVTAAMNAAVNVLRLELSDPRNHI